MNTMKVPLLDLKEQYKTIKKEVLETAEELFESQYFILGPRVAFLEKEMLCDRVNWFYGAGNTARETAKFFDLDYTIVIRLLRQGGSI